VPHPTTPVEKVSNQLTTNGKLTSINNSMSGVFFRNSLQAVD